MDELKVKLNEIDIDSLKGMLCECFPNMIFVDLDLYEDAEHNSYKHLYNQIKEKYADYRDENFSLNHENESLKVELSSLSDKISSLEKEIKSLKDDAIKSIESITGNLNNDIYLDSITVYDSLNNQEHFNNEIELETSINPGVYKCKRPSYFTELEIEFDKLSSAKESVKNTKSLLAEKLLFWKKMGKAIESGKIDKTAAAAITDRTRENNIKKLLNEDLSNEEKYLKYILLTPGINPDLLNTFNGAADLGLNANIVIQLLEQPKESYNEEIVVNYISQARKSTQYNFKKEVAKDLLLGKWYFTSENENSNVQKYQLVPFENIKELIKLLSDIKAILEGKEINNVDNSEEGQLCAKLSQGESEEEHSSENNEDVPSDGGVDDFIPDDEIPMSLTEAMDYPEELVEEAIDDFPEGYD